VLSQNDYWKNFGRSADFKMFNQSSAKLAAHSLKDTKDGLEFYINNPSKQVAIGVKLNVKNSKSNEIILPSYFSEGYINLLPGESRRISVIMDDKVKTPIKIVAEGYNTLENNLFLIPNFQAEI
jgi:hypothetical protein